MVDQDIDQVGGIGKRSILKTHTTVTDLDPWVLSAIGDLTRAAIASGYWDPSNLDDSFTPPMPNRAHPIWEIVLDKRYTLSDQEAVWTRPMWLVAEDGLPCVRWVSNIPLAFVHNRMAAPSSSVPSDIGSEDSEEERRGRRQTPRSQPATGVTRVEEKKDKQERPEEEEDVKVKMSELMSEGMEEDLKNMRICDWD